MYRTVKERFAVRGPESSVLIDSRRKYSRRSRGQPQVALGVALTPPTEGYRAVSGTMTGSWSTVDDASGPIRAGIKRKARDPSPPGFSPMRRTNVVIRPSLRIDPFCKLASAFLNFGFLQE